MKLSRLTDYAVIVLTKLSFADDEPASANESLVSTITA